MPRLKINGKRGDVKKHMKDLLIKYPKLRDNKILSAVSYWYYVDAPKEKVNLDEISAKDFMTMYKNGVFENQASLDRMWQKIQEEEPSLRGLTWKDRQKNSPNEVKSDLGYNV